MFIPLTAFQLIFWLWPYILSMLFGNLERLRTVISRKLKFICAMENKILLTELVILGLKYILL